MARISELHYSNRLAQTSGEPEFLEVSLSPGESASDFSVAFYQADGSQGEVIALSHSDVDVTVDPITNEIIHVISNDPFGIFLTDPDGGGATNYEAYALVNTTTGEVIDFYDIGGGTIEIEATDGIAQGATSVNLPVLVGPDSTTTTLQFNLPNPDTLVYEALSPGAAGVLCFARGTLIRTPDGEVPIEHLKAGDLVETVDNGAKPVSWIGHQTVAATRDMAPIVIKAGVLNNSRPLVVSPQHRIFVSGPEIEMLFGAREALVPAKHLVNDDTIVRHPGGLVTYYHMMLDQHELVWSCGALSESFFVCDGSLSILSPQMRAEFATLFPELLNAVTEMQTVRPVLKGREARLLALSA